MCAQIGNDEPILPNVFSAVLLYSLITLNLVGCNKNGLTQARLHTNRTKYVARGYAAKTSIYLRLGGTLLQDLSSHFYQGSSVFPPDDLKQVSNDW